MLQGISNKNHHKRNEIIISNKKHDNLTENKELTGAARGRRYRWAGPVGYAYKSQTARPRIVANATRRRTHRSWARCTARYHGPHRTSRSDQSPTLGHDTATSLPITYTLVSSHSRSKVESKRKVLSEFIYLCMCQSVQLVGVGLVRSLV